MKLPINKQIAQQLRKVADLLDEGVMGLEECRMDVNFGLYQTTIEYRIGITGEIAAKIIEAKDAE